MFLPRKYLKCTSEQDGKRRKSSYYNAGKQNESRPLPLSLAPPGGIFGSVFLSSHPFSCNLVRILNPKFCQLLLPLFSLGCSFPSNLSLPHTWGIRKTNSPPGAWALGPACLSPTPFPPRPPHSVLWACFFRGGWGIIKFLIPLEIRVARFTWGTFSSHILLISVKIKMQQVLFLQISMQILPAWADQGNRVH